MVIISHSCDSLVVTTIKFKRFDVIFKSPEGRNILEEFSKEFDNPELLLQSDLKPNWLVLVCVRLKMSLVDCQVEYEWIEEVVWK